MGTCHQSESRVQFSMPASVSPARAMRNQRGIKSNRWRCRVEKSWLGHV